MLFYLVVALLGAYVAIRLLKAALFFGPLLALALALTKPEVARFEEALRLLEKKQDGEGATATAAGGSGGEDQPQRRAGWLTNLIERTSALLQGNPVWDWAYLDCLFFIFARKKETDTFAVGVAKHWVMLTPARLGDWPWLPYMHSYGCVLAKTMPQEFWRPFPTSSSPAAANQLNQSGYGVDAFLSAAVNTAGSVLTASAASFSASPSSSPRSSGSRSPRRHHHHHQQHHQQQQHQRGGGRHSPCNNNNNPPGSPRRREGDPAARPMREWMRRAQALAEAGRFVDAGTAVEEGIARCRGSLRGGDEEAMELWIVAAAFFEAAQTSPQSSTAGGGGFLGRLRCLQRAGELAVRQGRWARAAELFDEGAQAWYDEKRTGTPFGLVASGKAAPLVLGSILACMMFGDHVKSTQMFRMACAADRATAPGFPRTPEGELAGALLEATRSHDAKALGAAHARYVAKKGRLEGWQEEAVAALKTRVEEGAHLR